MGPESTVAENLISAFVQGSEALRTQQNGNEFAEQKVAFLTLSPSASTNARPALSVCIAGYAGNRDQKENPLRWWHRMKPASQRTRHGHIKQVIHMCDGSTFKFSKALLFEKEMNLVLEKNLKSSRNRGFSSFSRFLSPCRGATTRLVETRRRARHGSDRTREIVLYRGQAACGIKKSIREQRIGFRMRPVDSTFPKNIH